MKTMKRVMSVILTFALVITLAAPTSTNAATHGNQIGHDSVKGIHLREKSKQLVIGESSQITVMNCKKKAKITYKTSKKSIVKVSKKGKITAVRDGKAKISVSVKNGKKIKKLTCKVTVKKPALSAKSVTIKKGQTVKILLKNKPVHCNVSWQVADGDLVEYNVSETDCSLTGKGVGTTDLAVKIKTAKKTYTAKTVINVVSDDSNDNIDDVITYTVTFDTGDSSANGKTVKSGDYVEEPADPVKEGYKFDGWYTDKNYTTKFDFKTPITGNTFVYAKWIKNESSSSSSGGGSSSGSNPATLATCKVSFDINYKGGSNPETQTVKEGSFAKQPEAPKRKGYQFIGWFKNAQEKDWKNSFEFGKTLVKQDMTLHALWVDMEKDSDNDGLSDELEAYVGTDPQKKDTDGDGLTDYQEVTIIGTDPLKPDTDGNGVSDYNEDYDGDGLTNGDEFNKYHSDPTLSDTDADGLGDAREIQLGTKVDVADTDGDGAEDGWEVDNGFDPLTANASFDVIATSNEVSEANPVAAGVEIQAEGKVADSLSVEKVTASDNPYITPMVAGYLGDAYDFKLDGKFKSAKLTFKYDTSLGTIGDDFQPRIYYFNEETKLFEELKNQTVKNGEVTAETTHFSTYILLNRVEFNKVWDEEIKPPMVDGEGNNAALNVSIVVDYSNSMYDNDPEKTFKTLSKKFISKLRDGKDKASVVKFIAKATQVQGMTSDKEVLNNAIDNIVYDDGYGSDSGTNGSAGYKMAIDEFGGSTAKYKYIIFITDGEDNRHSYNYDDLISQAKANGIVTYTIGMGNASESILQSIANGTGGKYYHATSGDTGINLDDAFKDIEEETVDLTKDSNNDGIPDYYNDLIKEGKLVLSNGSCEFKGIDFNYDKNGNPSDDWDGDGLKNGEELYTSKTDGGKVYLWMKSNPCLVNSDLDGVDDATEVANGSDPMLFSYEKSDVDYFTGDNFYFEKWAKGQTDFDKNFEKVSAAIFGVWNKVTLYQNIMVDYYSNYETDVDYAYEEKKVWYDTIMGYISNIHDFADDKIGNTQTLITGFYSIVDFANGAKDADELGDKLVARLTNQILELNKVSQEATKMRFETLNMDYTIHLFDREAVKKKVGKANKVVGKVCNGISYVGYGVDVVNSALSVAKINANEKKFENNIELLDYIADNSADTYAKVAASNVIVSMVDKFSGLLLSTAETVLTAAADIVLSLLADACIYVTIVIAVRDIIDILTGISSDIEQEYEMYAYHEMALAYKYFLNKSIDYGTGGYYNIKDDNV